MIDPYFRERRSLTACGTGAAASRNLDKTLYVAISKLTIEGRTKASLRRVLPQLGYSQRRLLQLRTKFQTATFSISCDMISVRLVGKRFSLLPDRVAALPK